MPTPSEADAVVSEALLLGILRAHEGPSEPEQLLAHFGRTPENLFAMSVPNRKELRLDAHAPARLTDLPSLSGSTQQIMAVAASLAAEHDSYGDSRLHLSHLFGGVLGVRRGVAYQMLVAAVGAKALDEVAATYGEFLDQAPNIRFADFLARRHPRREGEELALTPLPTLLPPSGPTKTLDLVVSILSTAAPGGKRPVAAQITGPFGSGKTHLAVTGVQRSARSFPDGQLMLRLGPEARPSEVEGALRKAVEQQGPRMAFVVEDVDSAAQIEPALDALPSSCALVLTSRERFEIQDVPRIDLGRLTRREAEVALFRGFGEDLPDATVSALAERLESGNLLLVAGLAEEHDPAVRAVLLRVVQAWADGTGRDEELLRDLEAADFILPMPGAPPAAPRSTLAGYVSDVDEGPDELGVQSEVDALCAVIAAVDVRPPLSIGLFGAWGTGKSFFMRLMRERITALAKASREARASGAPTAFSTHVKQIPFNAWHYADANLWASLVTRIFDGLAEPDEAPDPETRRAQKEERQKILARRLESSKEELQRAEAERDAAERRGQRATQLIVSPTESLRRIAADPSLKEQLDDLGERFGVAEPLATLTELAEARAWTKAKHLVRRLDKKRLVLTLVLLGMIATGVVLAVLGKAELRVLGAVGGVLAVLAEVFGVLRKPLEGVRQAVSLGSQLREQRELELKRLRAEVVAAKEKVAEAEAEIAEITSGRRLYSFIEERVAAASYREQLGIVASVRRDFERLAELLAESLDADGDDGGLGRIDRVILYVDDLDRCPSKRVVEVLEAVHLLLAFELFVVVVAVDSRWLLRSLQEHYATQLSVRPPEAPDSDPHWASTPQNYLEKIFQIPFALRPMDETGYGRLVTSMVPVTRREGAGDLSSEDGDEAHGSTELEPTTSAESTDGGAVLTEQPQPETSPPPPPAPSLDLDPEGLKLEEAELEFLKKLSALVPTPRATKRLVNTYRLLRASLDPPRLQKLVDGDYRTVLLLLAVLVGSPSVAETLFRKLLMPDGEVTWPAVVEEMGFTPTSDACRRWALIVARYSFQTGLLVAPSAASEPSD